MLRILLLLGILCLCLTTYGQYEKVQITDIVLLGNKKTKKRIITRELDFKIGDSLLLTEIEERFTRNENYVINTGLFVDAVLTLIDVDEENKRTKIQLSVKEGWYIIPAPSVSTADRNFNVWWEEHNHALRRLNLGMIFIHQNFTGRRDELKVTVQGGFTRKLELRYKYPYLNKAQTLGMDIGFLYSDNNDVRYQTELDKGRFFRDTSRNIFQRFRTKLGLTFRPSLFNQHALSLQYQDLNIDGSILSFNPDYFLNQHDRQQAIRLNYSFITDHRDNRFYALKGYVAKLELAKEGLGVFDDVDIFTVTASISTYLRLNEKLSLVFGIKGHRALARDPQPYHNYRALGSKSNLVRGYQLYLIDGLDYGYFKTDVRFRILDHTFNLGKLMPIKNYRSLPIQAYLTAFTDVGYVNEPFYDDTNDLNNALLWGSGIGLDVVGYKVHVGKAAVTMNKLGEWGFIVSTEFAF